MEQHPIITLGKAASDLGISYNTVSTAVKRLEALGVASETTKASRNRVFSYEAYLDLLRP